MDDGGGGGGGVKYAARERVNCEQLYHHSQHDHRCIQNTFGLLVCVHVSVHMYFTCFYFTQYYAFILYNFFFSTRKKIEKQTRHNRKSKRRRGVILLRVAKAGRQTSKKFLYASQSPCHHIVLRLPFIKPSRMLDVECEQLINNCRVV